METQEKTELAKNLLLDLRNARRYRRSTLDQLLALRPLSDAMMIAEFERWLDSEDRDGWGYFEVYALGYFACLRVLEAHDVICRFFSAAEIGFVESYGELYTEGLSYLYLTAGGNFSKIDSLIRNDRASSYARWTALTAYGALVAEHPERLNEVRAHLGTLCREFLESQRKREVHDHEHGEHCDFCGHEELDFLPVVLARGYLELMLAVGMDDWERLLNDFIELNLFDPDFASLEEIHRAQSLSEEQRISQVKRFLRHLPNENIHKHLGEFHCFREKQRRLRRKKKVGPNDLCPCDSGKKFKKCCGVKPALDVQI